MIRGSLPLSLEPVVPVISSRAVIIIHGRVPSIRALYCIVTRLVTSVTSSLPSFGPHSTMVLISWATMVLLLCMSGEGSRVTSITIRGILHHSRLDRKSVV